MSIPSPALTLGGLLAASGIAAGDVLVFRHRPSEAKLNRVFDWLAAERPDLFDCYQSTHGPNTEGALKRARYLASFIRHRPGLAVFVGLYEVASMRTISFAEWQARPGHVELMALGMAGDDLGGGRPSAIEFELRRTEWHASWLGRLIIGWPGLERAWYRWADRNEFVIEAIAEENLLVSQMPAWNELVLAWHELATLPTSWRLRLSQWRGIYLIIDERDGRQYVGSASGADNLLQRWLDYARTGHAGNKLLRSRDPSSFRYSILQLVSPDTDRDQVEALEAGWKQRLRSRSPFGLNEN